MLEMIGVAPLLPDTWRLEKVNQAGLWTIERNAVDQCWWSTDHILGVVLLPGQEGFNSKDPTALPRSMYQGEDTMR